MNTARLHASILQHIAITSEQWHFAQSKLLERHFKKGALLTREGTINRYTNYITEGSARVYYIDTNGNEHVIQLGIQGWWVGDFPGFVSQKEGLLFTEALKPTTVLSFSYDDLQMIYSQVPAFERFFRLLIQNAYVSFQYRILHNLSMDAEARYLAFRESYPEMEAQISQKHIASYLGVSAEFLSKIKKRIHQ